MAMTRRQMEKHWKGLSDTERSHNDRQLAALTVAIDRAIHKWLHEEHQQRREQLAGQGYVNYVLRLKANCGLYAVPGWPGPDSRDVMWFD